MEELKQYKVDLLNNGDLKIQSSEKLSPEELQPLLDSVYLKQQAINQLQKDIDRQHQIYTLVMVIALTLGLFTFSFVLSRTVTRNFKQSTTEVIHNVG